MPAEPAARAATPASRPPDTTVDPSFRYVHRLQVRFRDLDCLGHVNHAAYLAYVEQARTLYFHELTGIAIPDGLRWVIRALSVEYMAPLGFGEVVDTGWRLARLGRSSADYRFELAAGGRVVAEGSGVLVYADPRAGRSEPIPDEYRAIIAAYEGIPERS